MYINDYCCISPAGIFCPGIFPGSVPNPVETTAGRYFQILEPEYSTWIAPMKLRRMPRSVKLSLAATKSCFGKDVPASIHMGSAYCMLTDSELFLKNLIDLQEETLPPTPFIQSTHNTVSGALALELQAQGHNFTFAHRGHSFEDAFLDTKLFALEENPENHYQLVGGIDEITPIALKTLYRAGCASDQSLSPGEGLAVFKMSPQPKPDSIALVENFRSEKCHSSSHILIEEIFREFIREQKTPLQSTDILMMGNDQSPEANPVYNHIKNSFFAENQSFNFLEYCGTYPTASAFGLAFSLSKLSQSPETERCWMIQNFGEYWSFWVLKKP